jgi:hypothetical protein
MKITLAALMLLLSAGLSGQEGHPLRGTWHGSWGTNEKYRTPVTLVLDWDGDNITGVLNPGLRSSPIEKTSLDAAGWKFHFESNLKERTGTSVHISADAKIEDVTNPNRRLEGTWTQGGQTGDFKAVRDN